MKMLRDYQQEAFEAVLSVEDRALLVMACGTGKTFVAAKLVEYWCDTIDPAPRILVLCHLKEALAQAQAEFTELMPDIEISMFGGGERGSVDADVVMATFQTMARGAVAEFDSDSFDIIIVDEAHHAMAPTYREVIEHFEPSFLLGLTATPDRTDGQQIEHLFGEAVYTYDLATALAVGRWLSPVDYRVVTADIDVDALRRLVDRVRKGDRKVTLSDIDRTVFLKEKLEAQIERIVTAHAEEDRQTIVYCRNLSHLRRVHAMFRQQYPELRVATYHSGLKPKQLQRRYESYRTGDTRVILVVDKFNEAVDIPNAGLLAFLRVTDSWTVFEQQLGRGLRPSEEHPDTKVLDFVGNCRRVQYLQRLQRGNSTGEREKTPSRMLDLSGYGIIHLEEIELEIFELVDMLGSRSFYPTYAEASAAAQLLGSKGERDYHDRYKEYPRLPSNPNVFYAAEWKGWTHFLTGEEPVEKYPTLAEASAAAQALGIKGQRDYHDRYKEDPHLHSNPNVFYAAEWKGWTHFLTGEEPVEFYPTLAEASAAAQALGIKGRGDYHDRYKEDPHLPSDPKKFYAAEWKGWTHFWTGEEPVEFYPTLAEASAAAQALGIKGQLDYRIRRKEDPRLHSNPNVFYAAEWKGWRHFLGTDQG